MEISNKFDYIAVGDILISADGCEIVKITGFRTAVVNEFLEKPSILADCLVWNVSDGTDVAATIQDTEKAVTCSTFASALFRNGFSKYQVAATCNPNTIVFATDFMAPDINTMRHNVVEASRELQEVLGYRDDVHFAPNDLGKIKSHLDLLTFWANRYSVVLQQKIDQLGGAVIKKSRSFE